MKRLIALALAAVLILPFTGCEQGTTNSSTEIEGFKIEGSVENADSLLVVLDTRKDGEWINVDSAEVVDGSYTLSGDIDHAQMAYLKFVKDEDVQYIYVFLEESVITVSGDYNSVDDMVVSGSGSHDLYGKFSDGYNEFYEVYDTLYTMQKATDDQHIKDSLEELMTQVDEDAREYLVSFIKDNQSSQVAPYLALRHMTYDSEYDELAPIVSSMTEELGSSIYIDALDETLEKLKILAVGNIAPEFSQVDADGNAVSILSFRGKYVLVDFWASWCGPCRRENPNVVAMYNELGGEDFEIIGVSLDKDREKWLKAIEDDKLTWPHVSDLKGWKNAVADLYNVKAIPSTYLLDMEGKIVAKNLRGKELKEKIQELLTES